jgi:hypothetical protein
MSPLFLCFSKKQQHQKGEHLYYSYRNQGEAVSDELSEAGSLPRALSAALFGVFVFF